MLRPTSSPTWIPATPQIRSEEHLFYYMMGVQTHSKPPLFIFIETVLDHRLEVFRITHPLALFLYSMYNTKVFFMQS